jgi:hypothetical protein
VKPSKIHLTETVHLILDCLHDVRMTITVGHDLPGRNGVEDAATVGDLEQAPSPLAIRVGSGCTAC